ncbi:interference hedgehog isoform X3 [Agrilus planipennis]|uniref:Interference hedgehog n=1 Tax=Agrilus planipennis TaxID=224129 RepID=A0A1W4XMM2_AGRPL|nr:interference hedgehog isoform X3 [Agrilus planipennis]
MRCYILKLLVIFTTMLDCGLSDRGRVYMVTSPESVVMPINDETSLICEMNLQPDRFEWRHYPFNSVDVSNPRAHISLSTSPYINLPQEMFTNEKKTSTLKIKSNTTLVAGGYQCLAHYGASVVASIPGRITITSLGDFPPQENTSVTVIVGNTISWKCDPPEFNPPAVIDYYKDGSYLSPKIFTARTKSLILPNVGMGDSGIYKCLAYNNIQQARIMSNFHLSLKVVSQGPRQAPRFITIPKKVYVANAGDTIFIECSAYGNPVPKVFWSKSSGGLPNHKIQILQGGLLIKNISSFDDGLYFCNHTNALGTLSHHITVVYSELPSIIDGPRNTDSKEGENMDLQCVAKGTPEPEITWILNGASVSNDSAVEAVGNQIYFRPVGKRHAGILQCFAGNSVGITYSSANIKVFPKQISSSDIIEDVLPPHPAASPHRKRKHKSKKNKGRKGILEMIPPSKPTVSRLNDESVMVRWNVPANDGLNISFFKVQYKELGPIDVNGSHTHTHVKRWKTCNGDIAAHLRSYEINNLKPEHVYKFRIAAVYSNGDNKMGPNSARFALTRGDFFVRNPLPIPLLTHTEAVNVSSIRIYWEYTPDNNVTIDGFFVNYLPSDSAGDYMKETVDGGDKRTYIISYLKGDTMYDIKMQSFNAKSASEFSPIMKQKTAKLEVTTQGIVRTTSKESVEVTEPTPMYIFIVAGVVGLALLLSVIVLFIICRKWKQKKDANSDAGTVDKEDGGHHIQADASDYIVSAKSLSRMNGCAVPGNRITITSNPLADADNKKFLARIFSRIRT